MKKTFYICDGCGKHIKDGERSRANLHIKECNVYDKSVDLCLDCNLRLLTAWAKVINDETLLRSIGKLKFSV